MSAKRGIFTLSLDFELIWGTRDLFGQEKFRRAVEIEREVVIDRLLATLTRHRIAATWCIVGHLFLDSCAKSDGHKHADIVPPHHRWFPDWFADDPCTDEARDPLYYGRSLVEKVQRCAVKQEIGSHSFSHVIFGDPGCSRETARTELEACREAAAAMGIELRSFVFPRNEIAHLDVLRASGFDVYRGIEPHWYNDRTRAPEKVRRIAHLVDVIAATEPPVVVPERTPTGLWNVPGSMLYFPSHGLRRFVPMAARVKRAQRGLDAAVRERKVFHLWFHPTNLADNLEAMFDGLEAIFTRARALADRGDLEIVPMGDVPARFHATSAVAARAPAEATAEGAG